MSFWTEVTPEEHYEELIEMGATEKDARAAEAEHRRRAEEERSRR